jgi:hypothetical protein
LIFGTANTCKLLSTNFHSTRTTTPFTIHTSHSSVSCCSYAPVTGSKPPSPSLQVEKFLSCACSRSSSPLLSQQPSGLPSKSRTTRFQTLFSSFWSCSLWQKALWVSCPCRQALEHVLTITVYATWRIQINKPKDSESQHSPRPFMSAPQSLLTISPISHDLRNFSLPRERCLDASPNITARPLPIPPPYLAIGITSVVRPLPAIPNQTNDDQSSLSEGQMVDEFVIQPLRIRKTSSSNINLASKPLPGVSQAEQFTVPSTIDAMSSVRSFSCLRDNQSWPITTGCLTHDTSQEAVDDTTKSSDKSSTTPDDAALSLPALPDPAKSLNTPIIKIQQPTPTPSPAPESPTPSIKDNSRHSTIRVVSSHLQVPAKVHHSSLRRKWAGQHGFISL